MRELSAEEAPQDLAASSLRRNGARIYLLAFYSAFVVISAVVFGTFPLKPF
jgi:hypothetical protein